MADGLTRISILEDSLGKLSWLWHLHVIPSSGPCRNSGFFLPQNNLNGM
jgi:hypothetical protein